MAWLPFILSLLTAKFVLNNITEDIITEDSETGGTEWSPIKVIFDGALWWGFAQSPLTPALVYLLSDRVQFVLSGQIKGATMASLQKRVRRFTMSE